MPDQSSAADEHALLQEITGPLATLPDDAVHVAAEADFPIAFRGYDRLAVDAYVKKTSQLVAEMQSTRSPEAAVRRALERVGEQISGILQRAHETAEQITTQSRREAEDRLVVARTEAAQIAAAGERKVKDLDAETDRIWAERLRIVEDARELASQLLALADEAAARFPPAEDTSGEGTPERPSSALFDAEVVEEADELDEPDLGDSGPRVPPEGTGPAAEESAPSDDEDDAPPTVIMPGPDEPPPSAEHPPPSAEESPPTAEHPPPSAEESPPTAEHPPPTAEHPPPTAEHPPPTAEHPPPTAEHPVRPPSQPPPAPPGDPPGDPPRRSR